MSKFRVQSHGRLQEWVAEEKGYFKKEGLDYDFIGLMALNCGLPSKDGTEPSRAYMLG